MCYYMNRHERKYLLLEVSENITEDFRTELVKLRSIVTPADVDAPEVDLRNIIKI